MLGKLCLFRHAVRVNILCVCTLTLQHAVGF